eukprot:m.222331 g.222331  ORF g.222331 m.222331 type:complete len:207 (+) comp17020_c0_seq1:170-790(+)
MQATSSVMSFHPLTPPSSLLSPSSLSLPHLSSLISPLIPHLSSSLPLLSPFSLSLSFSLHPHALCTPARPLLLSLFLRRLGGSDDVVLLLLLFGDTITLTCLVAVLLVESLGALHHLEHLISQLSSSLISHHLSSPLPHRSSLISHVIISLTISHISSIISHLSSITLLLTSFPSSWLDLLLRWSPFLLEDRGRLFCHSFHLDWPV